MKIYIEVLIIFILMIMFIVWKWWYGWSTKRLLKKYNPEKDLGKLAEEKRKEIQNGKKRKGGEYNAKVKGREPDISTTSEVPIGLSESKGRQLLSTPGVSDDGKTSTSDRKNGSSIRKLLGRRRKNN